MAMTFLEVTRMMLNSMDFFELRRTAARYGIPYQGVRRQRLVKDLERKILVKSIPSSSENVDPSVPVDQSIGAVSAKPKLEPQKKDVGMARINTFSARSIAP